MSWRYSSFVVRCWQRGTSEQRIDVEQIQSGQRVRVRLFAQAADWMNGHCALTQPIRDAPDGSTGQETT